MMRSRKKRFGFYGILMIIYHVNCSKFRKRKPETDYEIDKQKQRLVSDDSATSGEGSGVIDNSNTNNGVSSESPNPESFKNRHVCQMSCLDLSSKEQNIFIKTLIIFCVFKRTDLIKKYEAYLEYCKEEEMVLQCAIDNNNLVDLLHEYQVYVAFEDFGNELELDECFIGYYSSLYQEYLKYCLKEKISIENNASIEERKIFLLKQYSNFLDSKKIGISCETIISTDISNNNASNSRTGDTNSVTYLNGPPNTIEYYREKLNPILTTFYRNDLRYVNGIEEKFYYLNIYKETSSYIKANILNTLRDSKGIKCVYDIFFFKAEDFSLKTHYDIIFKPIKKFLNPETYSDRKEMDYINLFIEFINRIVEYEFVNITINTTKEDIFGMFFCACYLIRGHQSSIRNLNKADFEMLKGISHQNFNTSQILNHKLEINVGNTDKYYLNATSNEKAIVSRYILSVIIKYIEEKLKIYLSVDSNEKLAFFNNVLPIIKFVFMITTIKRNFYNILNTKDKKEDQNFWITMIDIIGEIFNLDVDYINKIKKEIQNQKTEETKPTTKSN